MTSRVQLFRTPTTGVAPAAGTRQPGELWVNLADFQIGMIDASRTAQKLVAVRYFQTSANYAIGEFVIQAGALYVANQAVTAGAFSALQWNRLTTTSDIPAAYVLPTASTSILGGVRIDGSSITIASGMISATQPAPYVLPTASTTILGGVKVDGSTINIASGVISTVLPVASTTILGGVKVDGTTIAVTGAGVISSSVSSSGVKSIKTQIFIANGAYTPSTGMIACQIEMVGGGGGGAGVPASTSGNACAASGGGAGTYSRLLATAATVGASKAVTIGAGGTAGASGVNGGGNGGATSLGSLCTAPGGQGGLSMGSPSSFYLLPGGSGGAVGTGDISIAGNDGGMAVCGTGTAPLAVGGSGAGSYFGAGPQGGQGTSVGFAPASSNSGAGGSGGASINGAAAKAGGAGAKGMVVITEYCNV